MKRKIIATLMAVVLMCSGTFIVAEARSLSSYYDSLACVSDESGLYRMEWYERSECYTDAVAIEDASGLELYIKVKIGSHLDDATANVSAGIFSYRFWVD